MIRRPTRTLLALSALALAACGGQSNSEADSTNNNGDNASAPDPKEVVARVNGEAITAPALEAQIQAMSQRGQQVERQKALDELIDLKLMGQEAQEQGLPEQPEIAAAIKRQRDTILAQHLVRSELNDFEVSDERLRAAYEEQTSDSGGTEYKARHIVVDDEATAQSLIEQLDGGADFAELAKENSTGPSSERGGDLGWFSPDRMVDPIAEAVQDLDAGSYHGEPIKTQFGWHVLQLEDTREKEPPKFEQMKSKLRNQIIREKVEEYIASLHEEAKIERVQDASAADTNGNSDTGSEDNAADGDSGEAADGSGGY